MATRFPKTGDGLSLGIGMDLPWGPGGFVHDPRRGDVLAPRVRKFLAGPEVAAAAHLFFSWQPRGRARLCLDDYTAAWDDLWAAAPAGARRALHHTALNLGAVDGYRRGELLDFTNRLIERYELSWVNEDLGLWSLAGQPLPYPLPPYLTDAGLRAAIANTSECQRALAAPLLVEFPGFAEGVSVVVGEWDAYDHFRALAEATGSPVTLDVGHLLSWRWLRGWRGEDLFADLERLPLHHCFELHLSGCEIAGDRFFDAHHGVLLPEQLELLRRLLELCPNLRAVTYEDPRLDDNGELAASNRESFARVRELVAAAVTGAARPAPARPIELGHAGHASLARVEPATQRASTPQPDTMIDLLHSAVELTELSRMVRAQVFSRAHRGTGTLAGAFAETIGDADLDELAAAFLASDAAKEWRECGDDRLGLCLEEAFFDFAEAEGLGDPNVRRGELVRAVMRALAVSPAPAFRIPRWVRDCPGGRYALAPGGVLHAVLGDRYVSGALTPLLVRLLEGETPAGAEPARRRLAEMGLVTAP